MQNNRNRNNRPRPSKPIAAAAPKPTYHERCVQSAFSKGLILCPNPKHHCLVNVPGAQWPRVKVLNESKLITMMTLRVEASCECERQACEWAWASQDRLGLTTDTYVMPQKYYKGVFKTDTPAKRVVQTAYAVPDLGPLHAMFPNIHFVTSPFAHTHDHPISHCVTEICRRMLYDSLPKGSATSPKRYLDLHGNPNAAIAYCKNNRGVVIETMVEFKTPKDFLRSKKWPARSWTKGPIQEWDEEILRGFDGFISTHTAYYYGDAMFDFIFTVAPDVPIFMLMHRFTDDHGLINGELEYRKFLRDGVIMVQQKSVDGSDAYSHPDNSFWFEGESRSVGTNGMAWSSSRLCLGNWTVQACACDLSVVEPRKTIVTNDNMSTEYFLALGYVKVSVGQHEYSSPIKPGEQADFFNEMRLSVTGKPRLPKLFETFVARYKSFLSGPRKKYSIDGHVAYKLAICAFLIDCRDEAALLPVMFSEIKEENTLLTTMEPNGKYLLDRLWGTGFAIRRSMTVFEPYRTRATLQFNPPSPMVGLPAYCEVD